MCIRDSHKVMIPPDKEGYVLDVVPDGEYTINEPILTLQLIDGAEEKITMTQKWPIRVARPTAKRFPATQPLITGPVSYTHLDVYKRQLPRSFITAGRQGERWGVRL